MCAIFQDLCMYMFCMYCQRQGFADLQIKFELELELKLSYLKCSLKCPVIDIIYGVFIEI
jgi:hypothetical protein